MGERPRNPLERYRIPIVIGLALVLLLASIYPQLSTVASLTGNNCNGTLTNFGRCEQNTFTNIMTIPVGATSTSTTFTYPTPFSGNPFVAIQIINITYNNGFPSVPVPLSFLTTQSLTCVIPVALQDLCNNQANEVYFDPPVFQILELTATFTLPNIPSAGSMMYGQISGDSGATWTTLISMPIDGSNPDNCALVNTNVAILCQFGITEPALPPLVSCCHQLRIATSGGDGVTPITFTMVQMHFQFFLPPTVNCVQPLTATPKTSFIVKCFIPFIDVLGAITINVHWKAVSETG